MCMLNKIVLCFMLCFCLIFTGCGRVEENINIGTSAVKTGKELNLNLGTAQNMILTNESEEILDSLTIHFDDVRIKKELENNREKSKVVSMSFDPIILTLNYNGADYKYKAGCIDGIVVVLDNRDEKVEGRYDEIYVHTFELIDDKYVEKAISLGNLVAVDNVELKRNDMNVGASNNSWKKVGEISDSYTMNTIREFLNNKNIKLTFNLNGIEYNLRYVDSKVSLGFVGK